jgi:hypothetical protein
MRCYPDHLYEMLSGWRAEARHQRIPSEKIIVPEIYADASHLSHHDAKGHGCMIVTLGNGGYIFARSSKLKLTTASATDSEHYCLCKAAMYNIWLRDMLKNLIVKLDTR